MTERATTISRLKVENFLSLQKVDVSFAPLNVLVGPNGAGKTNLLKVFQFLGDVARLDLSPAIEEFGGFDNLLFRGERGRAKIIKIDLTGVLTKHAKSTSPDEYKLSFRQISSSKPILQRRILERDEEIFIKRTSGPGRRIKLSGNTVSFSRIGPGPTRTPSHLAVQRNSAGLATLRRLGEEYGASQVEEWAQVFENLRLFDINVERVRRPSRSASPEVLRADAANLAPFLQWMRDNHADDFDAVCEDVRFVLPGFRKFHFVPIGGSEDAVRVDIEEAGLSGNTPLARASFGTIRSIALFAMLHDPQPPKLTCLEEIDHGLHPHALDRLVDRLRNASHSTQIVLATHSPALVNRLLPNELIIVERDNETGASVVRKPDERMILGLKQETGYELGELWFSGVLGGDL